MIKVIEFRDVSKNFVCYEVGGMGYLRCPWGTGGNNGGSSKDACKDSCPFFERKGNIISIKCGPKVVKIQVVKEDEK